MTDESNPYLERDKEIIIKVSDKLPHWHQNGKIQFITFRLADALPQSKAIEIKDLMLAFENLHPKPWDNSTIIEYQNLISPAIERMLDNGYGSCLLRHKEARNILKEAINYRNGQTYDVLAYVIMPNHVHLLIHLIGENETHKIIQSIKRHSALKINQLFNRTGKLWMKRYFDRITRSDDHLKHYYNYIINNPKNLNKDYYDLYVWYKDECIVFTRFHGRAISIALRQKAASGSFGRLEIAPPQINLYI